MVAAAAGRSGLRGGPWAMTSRLRARPCRKPCLWRVLCMRRLAYQTHSSFCSSSSIAAACDSCAATFWPRHNFLGTCPCARPTPPHPTPSLCTVLRPGGGVDARLACRPLQLSLEAAPARCCTHPPTPTHPTRPCVLTVLADRDLLRHGVPGRGVPACRSSSSTATRCGTLPSRTAAPCWPRRQRCRMGGRVGVFPAGRGGGHPEGQSTCICISFRAMWDPPSPGFIVVVR